MMPHTNLSLLNIYLTPQTDLSLHNNMMPHKNLLQHSNLTPQTNLSLHNNMMPHTNVLLHIYT